jgi:hypothetical protein
MSFNISALTTRYYEQIKFVEFECYTVKFIICSFLILLDNVKKDRIKILYTYLSFCLGAK